MGCGKEPGDWEEMDSHTDDDRREDFFVDDPFVLFAAKILQRFSQAQPRSRSLQQVMVEFAAADAVTYRAIIFRRDRPTADQSGAEGGDGLQGSMAAVVGQVELELVHDCRSDPARTDLVAR